MGEAWRNFEQVTGSDIRGVVQTNDPALIQNRGWLLDIGDQKRPSYIEIIISHYKDPYQPTSIVW